MNIDDIIKGHETAVITAGFALLGVFVTAIVHLIQKWLDMRQARILKKLEFAIEFEKQHFFDPVLSFLDSDLTAMRDVYSLIFIDKNNKDNIKLNNEHLSQLPSVEARVQGLGDEDLIRKFKEFSRKRIKIANAIGSHGQDPYAELNSAIEIAGEIMNSLFQRARKLKN